MGVEALSRGPAIARSFGRPMTIGDIGKPDLGGRPVRPLGWAITPRSFEIHNQVRLERYATIRENHALSLFEDVAAKAWKATEPRKIAPVIEPVKVKPREAVIALLSYYELSAQPDITDEILARAHRAKAAVESRKLAAMPQPVVLERVKPESSPKTFPKVEVKVAVKTSPLVKQKEKQKEKKEVPKQKKTKKGGIIFKKDEPVSAYRLARAKQTLKILHQEKQGGVVFGHELNNRLGLELQAERSTLLPQLGIKDKKDGTNIPGFRKTLGTLVFNSLEDGDRKIHEANEKNIPVRIGGDGIVLSDQYAEKVLQEEREALRRVREELALMKS